MFTSNLKYIMSSINIQSKYSSLTFLGWNLNQNIEELNKNIPTKKETDDTPTRKLATTKQQMFHLMWLQPNLT